MTTAQVVETSVTVNNNNSPIEDYTHPDYHIPPTYDKRLSFIHFNQNYPFNFYYY